MKREITINAITKSKQGNCVINVTFTSDDETKIIEKLKYNNNIKLKDGSWNILIRENQDLNKLLHIFS